IIAYNLSVSSSDVGLQKPDLALFRYALDQAGVLARDAVYIGDRVDNDIIPAKTLGMTAIRIHQGLAASSPNDRLYPSDVHISKLRDLLEYF
ncbi:TPA: HAD family hydrolase, partial [Streptococcus equi subsp. zooepidemicus]|nr:HAD family hydrolase [Streptococcus equi subsp. zooepidemicus]HEL0140945.1 HAD family hydrolase [Streptococcus equi subsp. zooepidemicus]HEL0414997.1 HAD family hydrolase [Streptococcus equi subsp. zooepidemicus]HEL0429205.1 HAD family hydrolase [Streptococcus equi subsp. zooepidemicus]HEL0431340.1 HAD family hydrolase [Streptococcus equi subsp. zooepidemicus]